MGKPLRQDPVKNLLLWFDKPWKIITTILSIAAIIATSAYSIGVYVDKNDFILQKIQLQQACNTQLDELRQKINNAKIEEAEKINNNILDLVKSYENKKQNGK